jgi:hypothetical protein
VTTTTPTAQVYTVYLRANAQRSDMPGYRNAMCVVTPAGEPIGELLDFPVLNRPVLARSAAEALARFIEWQRHGLTNEWLLTAAWEVAA